MVKLNVQEEVDEEKEITDAPRMLRRKVGGNYGKGFSFNKKRRTRQVAMTRYVGERLVGKRLPGPLSKSSIKSSASSGRVVQGKVQGKESLSLQVHNFGLNHISDIATLPRMRPRRGRKRRKISTMAPMIRYVGGCQRGKRLPGR